MKANQISCKLCSSMAQMKFKGHIGYQSTSKFDIYHCNNCNCAFSNPLKTDPEIYNLIYEQAKFVPGYSRYFNYAEQVLLENDPLSYLAHSEDIYWSIKEYFKGHATKTIKVLEVGCGLGYLTYSLSKSGYDVIGLDISQNAITQARKKYGLIFECADIEDFATKNKDQFDVVILTEVIEHVEDIRGFIKASARLLKKNGDLVITTPNKSVYPKDILWETEPPPVHLWWLSEESFETLSSQLGFETRFIDFTAFNLEEIKKTGDFQKPFTSIKNYLPSRLHRLDTEGIPIQKGNHISYPNPEPRTPRSSTLILKKILGFFGILKPFGNIKIQFKNYFKLRSQAKLNRKYLSKRTTLCAVLKKKETK